MAYDLKTLGKYGYAPIGKLDDMIREAIVQLAAVGKTRQEIADVMDISYASVCRFADKFDIQIRRREYGSKLSNKTVEEFEILLKNGFSVIEISGLWDVDIKALYNWMGRNNMQAVRRKAIIKAAKEAVQ